MSPLSPDIVRVRAMLQQLADTWDVAAGLWVLMDSGMLVADDGLNEGFISLLGWMLPSLRATPLGEAEWLERAQELLCAREQAETVFGI